MVSAAKLRRAQDAIMQMRPYAAKLREILENLSKVCHQTEAHLPRCVLQIISSSFPISSNRGLAGCI